MKKQNEIYIIGAGISGLTAAINLERKGFYPIIIEKSSNVGGRIKTIDHNGLKLDLGFQVLLTAYPMVNKYLDVKSLDLNYLESGALIFKNKKRHLIGDPTRKLSVLLPTILSPIGSLKDKLKILKLNKALKKKSIESVFSSPGISTFDYLVQKGFSDRMIDSFFTPFFAGIFLEKDLKTSSRMFEFVYKMFGEGQAAIPAKGIGQIATSLKNQLTKTKFIFNQEVEKISGNSIVLADKKIIKHNGVIVTCNHQKLISGLNSRITNWHHCHNLYYEIDGENFPDNIIGLVADKHKLINNFYVFDSPIPTKKIISVTSLVEQNIEKIELRNIISKEIAHYTGSKNIEHIMTFKIPKALPEIPEPVNKIKGMKNVATNNIILAGDYLMNASLNAAMKSGESAAMKIVEIKSH